MTRRPGRARRKTTVSNSSEEERELVPVRRLSGRDRARLPSATPNTRASRRAGRLAAVPCEGEEPGHRLLKGKGAFRDKADGRGRARLQSGRGQLGLWLTSPYAQLKLGTIQVHHIIAQEPVQNVHHHRFEDHPRKREDSLAPLSASSKCRLTGGRKRKEKKNTKPRQPPGSSPRSPASHPLLPNRVAPGLGCVLLYCTPDSPSLARRRGRAM